VEESLDFVKLRGVLNKIPGVHLLVAVKNCSAVKSALQRRGELLNCRLLKQKTRQ
jgi:hypothetical protein